MIEGGFTVGDQKRQRRYRRQCNVVVTGFGTTTPSPSIDYSSAPCILSAYILATSQKEEGRMSEDDMMNDIQQELLHLSPASAPMSTPSLLDMTLTDEVQDVTTGW